MAGKIHGLEIPDNDANDAEFVRIVRNRAAQLRQRINKLNAKIAPDLVRCERNEQKIKALLILKKAAEDEQEEIERESQIQDGIIC